MLARDADADSIAAEFEIEPATSRSGTENRTQTDLSVMLGICQAEMFKSKKEKVGNPSPALLRIIGSDGCPNR